MSERRRWDLYVRDMLQACERVTAYTAGIDKAEVLSKRRTCDATFDSDFSDSAYWRNAAVAG